MHAIRKLHHHISVPFLIVGTLLLAAFAASYFIRVAQFVPAWYRIARIYPKYVHVEAVVSGDTLLIGNNTRVGLLGVLAPVSAEQGFHDSTAYAAMLATGKDVQLEYDSYAKDPENRLMAYVWIPCTAVISIYCHDGWALLNEVMIRQNYAQRILYQDFPRLKYDAYLGPASP